LRSAHFLIAGFLLFLGRTMAKITGNYTDEELIAGIRKADHGIFTAFYSQNFQRLAWLSHKYVKDLAVAEEIVQDAFMKIWENPDDLVHVRTLIPYLYRVVINQSVNFLNRQKNITQHHLNIAKELSDEYIETLIEDYALKELLHREIERLPDQCRKVFRMSRIDNLKYREIAAQLNIAEKTVENHIVYALKILRTRLISENEMIQKNPNQKRKMLMLLYSVSFF
jgi:RNA polymerase sigma-70 factor (ECF subfamily)